METPARAAAPTDAPTDAIAPAVVAPAVVEPVPDISPARARAARAAVSVIFLASGAIFASVLPRLPAAERPASAALLATMTPRPGRSATGRKGRRWVELGGEGALGRTADEVARARERGARVKAAAASRRAAARGAAQQGSGGGAEPS